MSPNINSFVGDLVEMARAMEELPKVQAQLDAELARAQHYADRIQSLELRIMDLKGESDFKSSQIHELEVARDDAELRFLELDEKASKVLGVLNSIVVDAKSAEGVLNPPIPYPGSQPVAEKLVEAQAVTEEVQAQPVDPKPEPHPFEDHGGGMSQPIANTGDASNVDSWASGPGQSEADPTVSTHDTSTLPIASTNNVTNESDAYLNKPSGRYSGKCYYDWATYVPLHQWLAEGGTEEDYNWRPGRPISNIG